MNLRTEMVDFHGRMLPRSDTHVAHFATEHDAACAHALMMAMDEWWSASDEHGLDEQQSPRETVQWIEARAQAILREWGFDSGEVE